MPDLAGVDYTALIALGFLGAVLLLTFGLFGWLMTQTMKRKKTGPSAGTE